MKNDSNYYNQIKLLNSLLKRNNAYITFRTMTQMNEYRIYSFRNRLHLILSTTFVWADTPQGRTFWLRIDSKWRKIYETYKKGNHE